MSDNMLVKTIMGAATLTGISAAVSGIALFWLSFTAESFIMVWHIISYPEKASSSEKTFKATSPEKTFKAACENCQELYDDDEYHLIHDTHLCEACR